MNKIHSIFIADLHLNPNNKKMLKKFSYFIYWASKNVQSIYILGDFFYTWIGDDGLEPWSIKIAKQLKWLHTKKVNIFFIHGNRDFLLGSKFKQISGIIFIKDPMVIKFGNMRVLLTHGDQLCCMDVKHQILRLVTRNKFFIKMFLSIPIYIRKKIINIIRKYSVKNYKYKNTKHEIKKNNVLKYMNKYDVYTLVHGHIHTSGLRTYIQNKNIYTQYILNDWKNSIEILCYNEKYNFQYKNLKYFFINKY